MELAAEVIIDKCRQNQSWNCNIRYADFPEPMQQTGFLCLLSFGWMDNLPLSHSSFMVNKEFVARIVAKRPEMANWVAPDLVKHSLSGLDPLNILPRVCNCSSKLLMEQGCKCGSQIK